MLFTISLTPVLKDLETNINPWFKGGDGDYKDTKVHIKSRNHQIECVAVHHLGQLSTIRGKNYVKKIK